jgi:hypothetical protein
VTFLLRIGRVESRLERQSISQMMTIYVADMARLGFGREALNNSLIQVPGVLDKDFLVSERHLCLQAGIGMLEVDGCEVEETTLGIPRSPGRTIMYLRGTLGPEWSLMDGG